MEMSKNWIAISLSLLFFFIGFLVSLDQYFRIGIWFQLGDLHHETFILSSFALAIGILVGSILSRREV